MRKTAPFPPVLREKEYLLLMLSGVPAGAQRDLRCRNLEVIQTVRKILAARCDRLRRPPRRACSAEAFLPAFHEKQQGFHVSAEGYAASR